MYFYKTKSLLTGGSLTHKTSADARPGAVGIVRYKY